MTTVTLADFPEPVIHESVTDLAGGSSSAVFSQDRVYRYLLTRWWGSGGPALGFAMLNPSKADAHISDPTITRCAGFARREGYAGMWVVNAHGLRATDPAVLRTHPDPVGPCNDAVIAWMVSRQGGPVVVAWGATGGVAGRTECVARLLTSAGAAMVCLGTTRDGNPRHPLYMRAAAPLVPWQPRFTQPLSPPATGKPAPSLPPREGAGVFLPAPSIGAGPPVAGDGAPATGSQPAPDGPQAVPQPRTGPPAGDESRPAVAAWRAAVSDRYKPAHRRPRPAPQYGPGMNRRDPGGGTA